MRLPARKTKASRLLEDQSYYLQVRLQSDPECADFSTRWTACHETFRAVVQGCTERRLAATRTLADRDGADGALDRQVRLLHRNTSALVKSNPRSRLLQTYFPDGSFAITAAHPTKEVGLVEALLAKLANETQPILVALREPLQVAYTACQAAVERHEAALQALRNAIEMEQAARLQWFADYQTIFHDLRSRFIDDPARVETYFKSPRNSFTRDDDEEDDAGEDVTPVTPPAAANALTGAGAVADASLLAGGAASFEGDGFQGELNT